MQQELRPLFDSCFECACRSDGVRDLYISSMAISFAEAIPSVLKIALQPRLCEECFSKIALQLPSSE